MKLCPTAICAHTPHGEDERSVVNRSMSSRARKFVLQVSLASLIALMSIVSGFGLTTDAATNVGADIAFVDERLDERLYEAEIRRTEFGIPHIKANDYGSLGFGAGYAFAEDNLCVLADSILTVSAERARYVGATQANIGSDLFFQWLKHKGFVQDLLDGTGAFPPPSAEARALVRGYVAGYNAYLLETGVDNLSDPTCRGQAWVRPISEFDLWSHYYKLMTGAGMGAFVANMIAATPPEIVDGTDIDDEDGELEGNTTGGTNAFAVVDELNATFLAHLSTGNDAVMASNAYALGRDATVDGTGMLLGNPHYPWHGERRFYRQHLTIPGELNVTGASIFGFPILNFGYNDSVAWTHTVSTAQRFTPYAVSLVPGSPTTYLYDGEPREMTAHTIDIMMQLPDGALVPHSHTFYETHYGPVIHSAQMPWTPEMAFTIRDANVDNIRAFDMWLAINKASSVREVKHELDYFQGMPWVNTIAVDARGEAFYGDHSVVPHVTPALMAACGWPVLDGSRSECEWGNDPDAAVPGIFGPGKLPTLIRTDYVANMNNSYWLANPEQPLTGYSPIIGSEETNIGLRPRLGLHMIEQRLDGTDGMVGTKFTLEQLQEIMFNNRNYGSELVRFDLAGWCTVNPQVTLDDGTVVDIAEACPVLLRWDGKVDVDSRGAHLFREFVRFGGLQLLAPFDVNDPLNTPHTLDMDDPRVLQGLARAVQFLRKNDIPLDAAWGDVHTVTRAGEVIRLHGGSGSEGVFNAMDSSFEPGVGYSEMRSGASFVMAVEFTEDGPVGRALLAYSQSTNPASPHYADQTRLYADKQWTVMKFDEEDILAEPELRTYTVRGTDTGRGAEQ